MLICKKGAVSGSVNSLLVVNSAIENRLGHFYPTGASERIPAVEAQEA
jgi:hypothetical protein